MPGSEAARSAAPVRLDRSGGTSLRSTPVGRATSESRPRCALTRRSPHARMKLALASSTWTSPEWMSQLSTCLSGSRRREQSRKRRLLTDCLLGGRRGLIYAANSGWWGKKDSNLRSHKTADLQSAPFATRDTPPFNSIGTHPLTGGGQAMDDVNTVSRWRAPGRARLWAKGAWQSQPTEAAKNGPRWRQIAIIRNP